MGPHSNSRPTAHAQGRLAVAMWEFSWMVRRWAPEAEYADWDRVLDELVLRGYNCVRIDAFPHLIAAGADGARPEQFTILPQRKRFPWGSHRPVRVNPRRALAAFVQKAAARGICVGLSAWLNDDSLHRRSQVRRPEDFARIWGETLGFLRGEGLLAHVAWVDLCNEFPLGMWAPGAYRSIFATPWWNLAAMALPWKEAARREAQRYFDEAIAPLRAAFPDLKFTFSFQAIGSKEVRGLDVGSFDLIEAHLWLSDSAAFTLASAQVLALAESPWGIRLHAQRAKALYWSHRARWIATLSDRMDVWARWARERGLPLYTSEAWGPVNYDDISPAGASGEWDWVKDVCAEGVRLAVEKGWRGICSSNFCQPHFEGMWADVRWHQEMTRLIRDGS